MFNPNRSDIKFYKDFNVLVIENAFDIDTNKMILNEMIANKPNYTLAKVGLNDGIIENIRHNLSCYYDDLYSNARHESVLLREIDFLFHSSFKTLLLSMDGFPFSFIHNTNRHETQVSRYGDSNDHYNYHIDSFGPFERIVTIVYYAYKEPKKFTGGEITFSNNLMYENNEERCLTNDVEKELKIEPKNNMLVVFSSFKPHSVLKTTSPENFEDGRFSANIWVGMKP